MKKSTYKVCFTSRSKKTGSTSTRNTLVMAASAAEARAKARCSFHETNTDSYSNFIAYKT